LCGAQAVWNEASRLNFAPEGRLIGQLQPSPCVHAVSQTWPEWWGLIQVGQGYSGEGVTEAEDSLADTHARYITRPSDCGPLNAIERRVISRRVMDWIIVVKN
jgi:hypothetical protein